jgi:hypothetical protein
MFMPFIKVQKHPSIPWSLYVGTLGMPGTLDAAGGTPQHSFITGQTAYMAWKEYLEDKAKTVYHKF